MKKPEPDQINLSTKQALGVFCILLSIFTYFGGFGWVSAMWDTELQEVYRGHEIHYIPYHNMYGVNVSGPVENWPFNMKLQGCRNMIDNWLDDPTYIETYKEYEIYRESAGLHRYYGVDPATGEQVTTWTVKLQTTRDNLDQRFYGLQVWVMSYETGDTWHILKKGYSGDYVYWAEHKTSDTKSPEFDTQDDAEKWVRQNHENITGTEEPAENNTSTEPGDTDTDITTIGEVVESRRILISGITAAIGIGLVAIDYGARRDE